MRFIFFLFMGLWGGCHSRDKIDVTGAVERPGMYDYVAEWHVVDYVGAAGGYTPEAIAEQVVVKRAVSEAVRQEGLEALTFTLADVPKIQPGDQIVVPGRRYDVKLDSAYVVHDMRLERDGEIFRVERGALVTGKTERGAVVAMVLGTGHIFDVPDTTDMVSVFHYLFVHLHPDEFQRIKKYVAAPVDSLEAMEDAEALFVHVFPLRGYQVEMQAEIPPKGFFEPIPGLWARPQNNNDVPLFVRKRKFPDGRVWTVFPDGRQRWQHPDGRVEMTFVDGKKETRFRDGRIEHIDLKGEISNISETQKRDRPTPKKDTGRVVQRIHGDLVIREEDGTERVIFGDGGARVKFPDGREVTQYAGGQIITRYPGGNHVIQLPDGREYKIFADGRELLQRKDGSSRLTYPNGRVVRRGPRGQAIETTADGRTVVVNRFGHKTETFLDGKRTLTMPDYYAYPTVIKKGLAHVETVPQRVAVGDVLLVQGQLLESVEKVRVAAFMVPDGVVVEGDLRHNGKDFSARFRFQEAGHCCVQVQVKLPGARTETVSHQTIEIGHPAPLTPVTFDLNEYPGDDEANDYLIDQINMARKKVDQLPVMPHPDLMRLARIRLNEMMALGEVSHYSTAGLDVGWHLRTRRLDFHTVGENVASGQALEVLHPHWMASAGHRGNVLKRDWTHVGTAVSQNGNGVWAVEIFGK